MTEDREKILRRIQKCLRLSQSSEPHEAAAALRQAKALMDKHGISATQAELADIGESKSKTTSRHSLPRWEAKLASLTATTLGCRVLFEHGEWRGFAGSIVFLGAGASPSIAAYAFDVLRRQLRKARKAYRESAAHVEARHMDLFSEGWVYAVKNKIGALRPADGVLERVDAYLKDQYDDIREAKTRDRSGLGKGPIDASAAHALRSGHVAGQDAQLHGGLNRAEHAALPQ